MDFMNSFPTRSLAPALKTLMTYQIQHRSSKAPQLGLALSSLTFVWCLQSLTVPWGKDHNAHFTGGKIEIWPHVQDRGQVTCQISEPHSVSTELGSCHGSGWLRDTLQSPRNPQTHNEKGEQGATGWPVGGTRGLAVLLIQLDSRYTEACEFFVQIHTSSSEVPSRLLPCCVLRLRAPELIQGHPRSPDRAWIWAQWAPRVQGSSAMDASSFFILPIVDQTPCLAVTIHRSP